MNSSLGPHFAAHKNYIRGIDEATCRFMSELSEDQNICEFVTLTASCHETAYMIDYLDIIFCKFTVLMDVTLPMALIFLLCGVCVLIVALGTMAFLTIPNSVNIVWSSGLCEYNAGATLLVMIIGMPDIISAFFFYEGDTELLVNEMLGTSLYLKAFLGGMLIAFYPQTIYSYYFVRDVIAYLFGILVLSNIVSERETSVFQGICAMVFYPAVCFIIYVQHSGAMEELKRAEHRDQEKKKHFRLIRGLQIEELPVTSVDNPLNLNIWRQFCLVVNPFRSEVYDNAARWQKILICLGIGFAIPLKLTIPVVHRMLPGHGWSRLLIFINLVVSPILLIGHFSFKAVLSVMSVTASMGVLFLLCTKTNKPRFQLAISCYGIMCEMLLTHYLATETISILVIVGNVFGLRRPIIGTTLLAWGNTIPEVISYLTLVNWNIKTLSLAEFFMAALLNMIFGMGLTTMLKSIGEHDITVVTRAGATGTSGMYISVLHHVFFSFAVIMTDFQMRKSLGYYSILIYLLFVLYTFLYQFDAIHPYGTGHSDEARFIDVPWA